MPGNTDELQLYYYDPATDGDLTFNITQALKENWDKIDAAFKSRIKGAVADLAALKAINMTGHPDNALVLVKALGIYRYDSASAEVPDDDRIVQPTTGTGRWKLIIDANGKALDSRGLDDHKNQDMPHLFEDVAAQKTYKYGFKQQDNHLVFMYQEVV